MSVALPSRTTPARGPANLRTNVHCRMISSVTELPEQDFTARRKRPGPSSQAHCPFRAYLVCPAQDQATALLRRDPAAHVALDDPYAVASLLGSLRAAGPQQQATALADRLPGAGMLELLRKQEGRQDQFRFGREADGSPAGRWAWEDLD